LESKGVNGPYLAMKLLDLTLHSPAANVALDEALLEAAEAGEMADDVLRLWESPQALVVVGRSSKIAEEVDAEACRQAGVPIIRRASGGAAVVAGPGCLMYAVIQRYSGREHLRLLDEMHQHVLGIVRAAVAPLASGVEHVGICDLAIGGLKFSGNAVRCKRDHFLYHGTLLYDFELVLIERLLRMPPRQPDYRRARSHASFLTNVAIPPAELRAALCRSFGAHEPLSDWPRSQTEQLVASRHSQDAWNLER
jgi:lipoate-protein ligase A